MHEPIHVDVDLIQKYNRSGPRYTSYPTAPHFSEQFGIDDFVEEVDRTNDCSASGPLSVYVHLPFCRKLCYYCGCHMKVTRRQETIEKYLSYLEREIDRIAARIAPGREVVQLHWGGGTPTHLTPEQIVDLAAHLQDRFRFASGAELSLEADPRGLTEEHIEAARGVGFNRISFGVQDFTPEVQEAINRVQPEELTRQAVRWSRHYGFESLNLDLVYGLPYQDVKSFEETLETILDIDPNRIALFSYAHVPSIKQHQQLIPEKALPGPAKKLELFKCAMEKLTGAGRYRFIGMDHFARPGDELVRAQDKGTLHRNFQGYSTKAGADVYAFGVSGISQLQRAYAQNCKDLREYYGRIDDGSPTVYRGYRLTDDDYIRRYVIMQLMCNLELSKPAVERKFAIDFDRYFEAALSDLRPFQADGLIELKNDSVVVRPQGRLFIRNIAMAFDWYLRQSTRNETPVYSKTV